MYAIKFTGGTAFVIAATQLGYCTEIGEWTVPGVAIVPVHDADTFESLLKEARIDYHRWSKPERVIDDFYREQTDEHKNSDSG